MNYQKIYENLISKCKIENRIKHFSIYYEEHHIIPRCLNGSEESENKVLLTAREHFLAHKLLVYIYPKNIKILHAFNLMVFMNNSKYIVSSRDYARVRELFHLIPMDEETKKKISKSRSGDKNPQYGKPGFATGYKFSEKQKEKSSIAQKKRFGIKENHPLFNKHHSIETKTKIQKALFGKKHPKIFCEYCKKEFSLITYNKLHGENCNYKNLFNRFNRFSTI